MTAPLPPYQPGSPAWQAGYEHAKRQAVEVCGKLRTAMGVAIGHEDAAPMAAMVAAAHAILDMRPSPPRVSPGMEPTPYSAPTPRAPVYACPRCDAIWRTEWQRNACCTAEPETYAAPTTLHERWGPNACQRCGYNQPECTCIGEYVPPTTLHERVAAQDSGSGADALCGQPRGNEGVVG